MNLYKQQQQNLPTAVESLQTEGIVETLLIHIVVQEPMKRTFVRVSNWFSKVSNLESNLSS